MAGRELPCTHCGRYTPQNVLMEIKTDAGEMRESQIDFHTRWRGRVAVARDFEEALRALGLMGVRN